MLGIPQEKVQLGELHSTETFTAAAPNVKWCGDITEIPTDEGKLYLASVLDLHSRRLLASAISEHPDAGLACDVPTSRAGLVQSYQGMD